MARGQKYAGRPVPSVREFDVLSNLLPLLSSTYGEHWTRHINPSKCPHGCMFDGRGGTPNFGRSVLDWIAVFILQMKTYFAAWFEDIRDRHAFALARTPQMTVFRSISQIVNEI